MADHAPLLDLSRMDALRRVRLRPRAAAEGTYAGPHASSFRGTGVEFADYRSYADGDDIRLVDWKVFAKTDRYYVRVYETERNLLTYLLVDTSASMGFAGEERRTESKLRYASRLAAALACLAIREGDEAGVFLGNEQLGAGLPARGAWPQLLSIVAQLDTAEAAGKTHLGVCLRELFRRVNRRGIVAIFSDFLDDLNDFWPAIDLYRHQRFDVLLFHLMHPEELALPEVPMARFVDPEEHGRAMPAEPDLVRDLYARRLQRFLDGVKAAARTRGCDWYLARTDVNPYQFLQQCFLTREAGG